VYPHSHVALEVNECETFVLNDKLAFSHFSYLLTVGNLSGWKSKHNVMGDLLFVKVPKLDNKV
jgi:hypothetical protein